LCEEWVKTMGYYFGDITSIFWCVWKCGMTKKCNILDLGVGNVQTRPCGSSNTFNIWNVNTFGTRVVVACGGNLLVRLWPLKSARVFTVSDTTTTETTAVARWKCDDSNEMQDWVLWHLGPSQPNQLNRLQSPPRYPEIPSGKRLHNYGKSPFFMGNSTINGHFQ
jgi:hypothetical protein